MNRKLTIIVILVLACFLRLWRLDKFPPGFTPDEAAQGYTAYSILKTGKDEWGKQWPLNFRSFGDFKPPLQTYLMIPSIAVFGLNKFAVRFPNAALGILAILGVFLLVKKLFANKLIAVISSMLLAFSPWHIMLSRGAFEANLTVFFISFGIYFLLKNQQFLAALFLGLNMFSYHSAKILTPLIILLFIIYHLSSLKIKISKLIINNSKFIVIFSIFFLISFSSFFSGGQNRGLDIAIFNPTDKWQAVADERWWGVKNNLPDFIARLFHNKATYSLSKFAKNYLSYFSPQFLFSEGQGEGTYGMIPGRGVLWWWELPIILFGLYWLVKKPNKETILILAMILLVPIPAALTKGTRAANRAAVMMPWIQVFGAWSIWKLKAASKNLKLFKKMSFVFLVSLSLYLFISFFEDYFIQSPRKIAKSMLYGRCEAMEYVAENMTDAENIIVSRKLSEPQAYVLFCLKYPPKLAQKEVPNWLEYQEKGLSFVDQLGEYRLGKFVFRELNWQSDSKLDNTILVGLPKEFPADIESKEIINYPNGEPAVIIYQVPKQNVYASKS